MTSIICPRCGAENPVGSMNCRQCRINLKFALENVQEIERIRQRELESPTASPQGISHQDLEIADLQRKIKSLTEAGLVVALFGCIGAVLAFSNLGRMFYEGGPLVLIGGGRSGRIHSYGHYIEEEMG